VSVPTIDGMAQLTVPALSQNGDVLRMRGKGVADPRGRGRGDQLVHVKWVYGSRTRGAPLVAAQGLLFRAVVGGASS
jgi:DnaJ-class molecular chaperone